MVLIPLRRVAAALLVAAASTLPGLALALTLPPSGDNQMASVTQHLGLVTVTVTYSSPRVHRDGQDRTGKIWGELVPYGLADLGFNDCKECPWRAGANENTTFTVSHDVTVQGQPLPAGTYGLHMIPGPKAFTLIFSKDAGAWGSYWYEPKLDALRVDAKPVKTDFHEYLSYDFLEREPDRAVLALQWETLRIPFTIAVPDGFELYFQNLKRQLHGAAGFNSSELLAAAQFTLRGGKHLEEGLVWAQRALSAPFVGQENFQTLATLGQFQLATGKGAEADATLARAIAFPGAKPTDGHQLGRALLQQGKSEAALKVFQANAKRFPNQWPVNVGLARGYAATGNPAKAQEFAKLALAQAPDEGNRKSLEALLQQLKSGTVPK